MNSVLYPSFFAFFFELSFLTSFTPLTNPLFIGFSFGLFIMVFYLINELRRSRQRFFESEHRFNVLFNASLNALVIHDQAEIIDCNQVLCDITGYTKDEIKSMNGLLLLAPQYRDLASERMKKLETGPYKAVGLKKNGEEYPVKLEISIVPYRGKKVRMVELSDLTELKKQKELSLLNEARYQMLANEMPLGLVYHELIVDEEGNPKDYRFLSLNDSYETLTGLKREDVLGKTVLEVLPNTEKTWIENFGKVALNGQSIRFEEYSASLDKTFDVSVFSPQPNHFAVIVDDITDKKLKEMQVAHLSNHDYLTGLPNRRYCDNQLHLMDKPQNYPLLISLIDMDGLKLVNDAYGHPVGDMMIKTVAYSIATNIRPQDFAARIGGDEFLIICPNTTVDEFRNIMEGIYITLKASLVNDVPVTLSYGVDIKSSKDEIMNKVLINAENDMYAQKVMHGQSSRNEAIMTLFNSLVEKYEDERNHSQRVGEYCKMIGEQLGLSNEEINELEIAGMMHDVGKITIPDSILHKPDRLTESEWEIMKRHTVNGYQILRSADKYSRLAEYALTHHERWDGLGYPNGLQGEDIPLFSRIIAVCDSYEAMTSDRVYRSALSHEEACEELLRCAGSQFDPMIVDIFVNKVLSDATSQDDLALNFTLEELPS